MHRSNTDGNNFEAINSEETARFGATEFLHETSRLDVKQPERDSCWQGDIPQLSNDGLVWSGAEAASRNAFQSIARCGREKRVATQTISAESARVESVKANWNVNC